MEIVPDSSYVYEVVLVQSWPPTPCNHCQHISAFLLTKKRKKRKKEKKFIQQTLCCSRFKWTTESWPMNLQKGKKKRQVSIKKKKSTIAIELGLFSFKLIWRSGTSLSASGIWLLLVFHLPLLVVFATSSLQIMDVGAQSPLSSFIITFVYVCF